MPEAGSSPIPGYRLVRLRGRGGFATVWEAAGPGGENVALKFMAAHQAPGTSREIRSIRAIQVLEHPHLLRHRDVWSAPGAIVIGMDLADGSLVDLLELYLNEFGTPIDVKTVGRYLAQAAAALDYLNARHHRIDGKVVGLQHGDVKPNNILLLRDVALLADYGLATPTHGPLTPCPRQGTAEFCAPEVFRGHLTDRSDQFALAVTYYVVRTGSFPFPEPPPRAQLKNYQRPEPDLSRVTAAEQGPLARALSPIPQQRYPTCCALMTDLLTALGLRAARLDGVGIVVDDLPPGMSPPAPAQWAV